MSAFACNPRRRKVLLAGGSLLMLAPIVHRARAAEGVVIDMAGTASGAHVWFRPRGVRLRPGQAVRWVNRDAGNVHTVTAYHPDNGKPQRIPVQAASWNSGYLMPETDFVMVFDVPGVYDYFCIPHEQAGMVGRIVVVGERLPDQTYPDTDATLPQHALAAFPSIDDIMQHGRVN